MAASGRGVAKKDGSAKSIVADQISQSVKSTSNLLHLMLQSSPSLYSLIWMIYMNEHSSIKSSWAQLMKLPRNLLAMTSTIKNTESVLEQMPQVISSLDAHVERGFQCLPHLDTVVQLLSNMQNNQLKSLSRADLTQQKNLEPLEQGS